MSVRKILGTDSLSRSKNIALRFFQFLRKSDKSPSPRLGAVSQDGAKFVDLNVHCMFPNLLTEVINRNFDENEVLRTISSMESEDITEDIELLPPIQPSRVISINCTHPGPKKRTEIIIANKLPSSLSGPMSKIEIPENIKAFKCRAELGLVMGKEARHVSSKNAMHHLFGYTSALNVFACKYNATNKDGSWLAQSVISESCDTFCPIGPTVVHKSVIPDPHDLKTLYTKNGETIACDKTDGLLYPIEYMIEFITRYITLLPGDVILTGPPNLTNYVNRCDVEGIRQGDILETRIHDIGHLRSEVVSPKKVIKNLKGKK